MPIPLTPIVGREREIASVCALLRRNDVRLITLTGPGGVGKTRLAFAVANEIAGDFPDGARVVSLAAINDPDLVAPAIAQTLGVREAGEHSLVDDLATSIGARRLLLVLDSFERVIDATPLLMKLLASCANIKIVVTSQSVLHATAEHLFPVSPLALPTQLADAIRDAISASAAVQLFALRAAAASGDFELTGTNAAIVSEICRRLDGLPLAIELAAARIRFFSPIELLARLDKRLPLLSGGPFDAPIRQRTLRDTIAWSYDLLDERAKRLLRRLTMFAGGFTFDAVAAVIGPDEADGIVALVDQSLLTRIDTASAGSRFAMLDTVREFALDQLLELGEEAEARQRHADWCLTMLASAEASLGSASQGAWANRLDAEMENLREAMRAAQHRDDRETLARIAGGLWEFWFGRGYLTEGRLWLTAALESASNISASAHIKLLIGSGALAHAQGEDDVAAGYLMKALETARRADDQQGLAMTLYLLGLGARDQGDYPRAIALLNECLALSRANSDHWKTTLATNSLAVLYQRQGEFPRAAALLKESADLARSLGDQWGIAQAVSNMAHLAHRQGHFEQAIPLYEESALLYRLLGDTRGEAGALTSLGRIADRQGDTVKAIALHEQSLAVTRLLGDRRGAATTLANLGMAYLRQGNHERASEVCRESLQLRHQMGDREGIATSLENLAEVATASEQSIRAVRLWAAAAALRDAIGAPLAPSERDSYHIVVSAARSSLAPERMALLWDTGRSLPLDTVIQEALHEQVVPATLPETAMTGVSSGRNFYSSSVGLTPREVDVLQLLEEHSDREIAERLSIGSRTVSTHVTNILTKLGVNTRTSAVAYAIRRGMI